MTGVKLRSAYQLPLRQFSPTHYIKAWEWRGRKIAARNAHAVTPELLNSLLDIHGSLPKCVAKPYHTIPR